MHWGWPMMGGGGAWGWGWMLLGTLTMLLFWGGLAVLVVWAVRQFAGGRRPNGALEVLRERYARGEIDAETYQRMRRELEDPKR